MPRARLLGEDPRPVAATFRSRVFNAAEGFVQAQAAGLKRYQPLVVGLIDQGNVVPALEGRVLLPVSAAERLRFQIVGQTGSLGRRLRDHRPAILHAHFGTDGLLALPLARAGGIPLVTTLRGYDVNLSVPRLIASGNTTWVKYGLMRRRLMEGGDLFLTVSDSMREKAVALGYPEDRTRTHYNGVDLTRFRPGPEPREEGLVLFVGRLVAKKGTRLMIRAFAKARKAHPEARLVIIGEGPFEGEIRRQIVEVGGQNHVTLLGHRRSEEVASWMRRAAILVAPSVTGRSGDAEGLPNVVVEASASGTAVVATIHAGIPEAVLSGETGLLVPEQDEAALAGAIETLLASPAMREAMGAAGRRRAEERFDGARQMEKLETYYDDLCGRAA